MYNDTLVVHKSLSFLMEDLTARGMNSEGEPTTLKDIFYVVMSL